MANPTTAPENTDQATVGQLIDLFKKFHEKNSYKIETDRVQDLLEDIISKYKLFMEYLPQLEYPLQYPPVVRKNNNDLVSDTSEALWLLEDRLQNLKISIDLEIEQIEDELNLLVVERSVNNLQNCCKCGGKCL